MVPVFLADYVNLEMFGWKLRPQATLDICKCKYYYPDTECFIYPRMIGKPMIMAIHGNVSTAEVSIDSAHYYLN